MRPLGHRTRDKISVGLFHLKVDNVPMPLALNIPASNYRPEVQLERMPHAIQAGVAATHESVYRFVCFGTVRTHCDKGGTTTAAVTERRWIAHSDAMPRQKGPRAR